ncbi:RNA-directed DNA polymerase, eukaryota [Tanacetum coccineum]
MGDLHSFNSKEDQTQKISKSVFVTNFLDDYCARDLWNVCVAYGKVIDVYISVKKSKAGKRFAFVRFLKVDNLDRLIDNLCTIWIGRVRLHANAFRFQKEPRNYISQPKKVNKGIVKNSFATVLKTGKIKDINALSNLYLILANEGFENVKLTYLGGFWVFLEIDSLASKEKIRKHVELEPWTPDFSEELGDSSSSDEEYEYDEEEQKGGNKENNFALAKEIKIDNVSESSCMHVNDLVYEKHDTTSEHTKKSEDPFGIYKILKKNKDKEESKGEDP